MITAKKEGSGRLLVVLIFFCFVLAVPQHAQAQLKVVGGTILTIADSTTVILSGTNNFLEIEPAGKIVNHGIISLGASVTVIEPAGHPITGQGYEETARNYSSGIVNENIAGLGLSITTGSALGTITVRRGHTSFTDAYGNPGIARWYQALPSNNSGLDASLRLHYDTTELGGIHELALVPGSSPDSGMTWIHQGGTVFPAGNYVETNNIDALDFYSLFPAPVTAAASFASVCPGDTIQLPYTAPPTFNPGNIFTAELSDDAGNFTGAIPIGSIASTASGTIDAVIPSWLQPGTGYRLRVNSSNILLNGSPSAAFEVGQLPFMPAIPTGDTLICNDTPSTAYGTAGSSNATSYRWTLTPASAGSIIANNDSVVVLWDTAYSGIVTLMVASVNDCGESTAASLDITLSYCTGLSHVEPPDFSIYPNPAEEFVIIQYDSPVPLDLSIWSMDGKEIYTSKEHTGSGQETRIDLSGFAKGIYFLKAEINGQLTIRKLVLR